MCFSFLKKRNKRLFTGYHALWPHSREGWWVADPCILVYVWACGPVRCKVSDCLISTKSLFPFPGAGILFCFWREPCCALVPSSKPQRPSSAASFASLHLPQAALNSAAPGPAGPPPYGALNLQLLSHPGAVPLLCGWRFAIASSLQTGGAVYGLIPPKGGCRAAAEGTPLKGRRVGFDQKQNNKNGSPCFRQREP